MDKRTQLVIKLNHVVSAHGFAQLSMAKIASLAGVSRATLYGYFKNKDAIIEAVVARHLLFIQRNMAAKVAQSTDGYALLRLNAQLLIGAQAPIFRADLNQGLPELSHQLEQSYDSFREFTVTQLSQLQAAGIVQANLDPAIMFRQDEIFIPAVIEDVMSHQRPLLETENLLTSYLTTQLAGSVTSPSEVEAAMNATSQFRETIYQELMSTYY